jgi:hypothetical protein
MVDHSAELMVGDARGESPERAFEVGAPGH